MDLEDPDPVEDERESRREITLVFCALAAVLGAAIWFGTQSLSRRDNFSDEINPWYFALLFAVAFLLGNAARTAIRASLSGAVLALTQSACYVVYPNTKGELSNLFPIADALLLLFASGSVPLALLGSRLPGPFTLGERSGPPRP